MAITPLSFTGISQFSNDFQTILNRAVAIAQLPVTALQNQQTNILQEKQLSTSFETAVSALAATVTNLGAIGASQAMGATSSDTSKVTIASTSATGPGQLLDHQHHFRSPRQRQKPPRLDTPAPRPRRFRAAVR